MILVYDRLEVHIHGHRGAHSRRDSPKYLVEAVGYFSGGKRDTFGTLYQALVKTKREAKNAAIGFAKQSIHDLVASHAVAYDEDGTEIANFVLGAGVPKAVVPRGDY